MKLNCIIDTCSCIILSQPIFGRKTLLKHFHQKAVLNYSHEVSREINEHMDKIQWPGLKNRKLITSRFSMNDYETKMLGKTLISRKKKGDKGETDNFLLSVDLIHHSHTKGAIIFLTDDKKAVGGFLDEWLPAFPAIKLWSSYEVILFLYSEKIIPSKDIAIELMKEVISFSAPKLADRSVDTSQKLLSLLKYYNKKIELVSQIIH